MRRTSASFTPSSSQNKTKVGLKARCSCSARGSSTSQNKTKVGLKVRVAEDV